VRQLLKDDKAGKLDLFKDIPSAKEEEEEEVDSKRTKKKMDLSTGPSNVSPANLGPMAPQPLKLPRRQSHRGTPRRGHLRLLRFGFSFSLSNRWSCGW
jgi:hypothetical protein